MDKKTFFNEDKKLNDAGTKFKEKVTEAIFPLIVEAKKQGFSLIEIVKMLTQTILALRDPSTYKRCELNLLVKRRKND